MLVLATNQYLRVSHVLINIHGDGGTSSSSGTFLLLLLLFLDNGHGIGGEEDSGRGDIMFDSVGVQVHGHPGGKTKSLHLPCIIGWDKM